MKIELSSGYYLIVGRISWTQELKHAGQGNTPYLQLQVAWDKDEKPQTIKLWGTQAEYGATLSKGTNVLLTGREESHEYQGTIYNNITSDFFTAQPTASTGQNSFVPNWDKVKAQSAFVQVDDDLPF